MAELVRSLIAFWPVGVPMICPRSATSGPSMIDGSCGSSSASHVWQVNWASHNIKHTHQPAYPRMVLSQAQHEAGSSRGLPTLHASAMPSAKAQKDAGVAAHPKDVIGFRKVSESKHSVDNKIHESQTQIHPSTGVVHSE
eukprot:scaffold3135_cov352-Prasinococcus_capsulatus_cf.AAC.2